MSTREASATLADLNTHHIQGYVPDGRRIDIPLISHIEGDLYVGGCIGGVRLPDDFDRVVSLYPWEQYTLGPTTERVEVKMYDASGVDDQALASAASNVVASLRAGQKTLVHCQAGLNRSNLVAATALMQMGRTAEDAIALLREKRSPIVLCNRSFEGYLLALGEQGSPE